MSMVSEDDPVTVLMCCHWVMHSSALNDGRYLLTILFIGVLGVDLMWCCIEDRVLVYRFVVSLIIDNKKTEGCFSPWRLCC
ncbi:hypothetical protein RAC83_000986 [Xylella fastidiosa]|nr:hypothetical protein [Xylella fastidiosa]